MKKNWERTQPVYLMEKEEIEHMIHSFMPDSKLKSFQLLGGGLSNVNYKLKVKSHKQPFLLRISNEENCKFEHALHKRLHKQILVPEIYFSKCQGNQSYSIMEWKEGIHLKKIMYGKNVVSIKQAGYYVGYHLAKMREIIFPEPGLFNESLEVINPLTITPNTFQRFMEEFLIDGHAGSWLGNELTHTLLDFSNKHKHLLKNIENETPALVHSDYNGLNILVSERHGDCEVTSIIDWEFSFAGPIYFDIGNMLRYENFPHFSEFENTFIDGLQNNGITLPYNWKKISKLVDLIALGGLLNHKHVGKPRVSDIKQLIIQTIKNWHHF